MGFFCLVLHAHLPYVRHPEDEDFLEEDWLYEAMTETYLPLLDGMDGCGRIAFLSINHVSPPLAKMQQTRCCRAFRPTPAASAELSRKVHRTSKNRIRRFMRVH